MNTKVLTNVAAAMLLAIAAAQPAHAYSDTFFCDNRLLQGHYGFALLGTKLAGPPVTGPQVGVAMADFDGAGTFTQIDTVTINGEPTSNFSHAPAKGTYTVNSDCTGTFTIDFTDGRPTVLTSFVVVNNGAEIDTVVTSVGGREGVLALSSVGKRVFLEPWRH